MPPGRTDINDERELLRAIRRSAARAIASPPASRAGQSHQRHHGAAPGYAQPTRPRYIVQLLRDSSALIRDFALSRATRDVTLSKFAGPLLEHGVVQLRFGQQLLQPGVLAPELAQTLALTSFSCPRTGPDSGSRCSSAISTWRSTSRRRCPRSAGGRLPGASAQSARGVSVSLHGGLSSGPARWTLGSDDSWTAFRSVITMTSASF